MRGGLRSGGGKTQNFKKVSVLLMLCLCLLLLACLRACLFAGLEDTRSAVSVCGLLQAHIVLRDQNAVPFRRPDSGHKSSLKTVSTNRWALTFLRLVLWPESGLENGTALWS